MTDNVIPFGPRVPKTTEEPGEARAGGGDSANYDTNQLLVDFAQMVLFEVVAKTPDHEKLYWILQHGRTCRLIRSTGGASFSRFMTRDPQGQPWEYDLTKIGEDTVGAAIENFGGLLPKK